MQWIEKVALNSPHNVVGNEGNSKTETQIVPLGFNIIVSHTYYLYAWQAQTTPKSKVPYHPLILYNILWITLQAKENKMLFEGLTNDNNKPFWWFVKWGQKENIGSCPITKWWRLTNKWEQKENIGGCPITKWWRLTSKWGQKENIGGCPITKGWRLTSKWQTRQKY